MVSVSSWPCNVYILPWADLHTNIFFCLEVAELRAKYDALITDVNSRRLRCHRDVESYIEKELVTRISDLQQQLTVIRSQLENSHKVWLFFSLISFVLGMWA